MTFRALVRRRAGHPDRGGPLPGAAGAVPRGGVSLRPGRAAGRADRALDRRRGRRDRRFDGATGAPRVRRRPVDDRRDRDPERPPTPEDDRDRPPSSEAGRRTSSATRGLADAGGRRRSRRVAVDWCADQPLDALLIARRPPWSCSPASAPGAGGGGAAGAGRGVRRRRAAGSSCAAWPAAGASTPARSSPRSSSASSWTASRPGSPRPRWRRSPSSPTSSRSAAPGSSAIRGVNVDGVMRTLHLPRAGRGGRPRPETDRGRSTAPPATSWSGSASTRSPSCPTCAAARPETWRPRPTRIARPTTSWPTELAGTGMRLSARRPTTTA